MIGSGLVANARFELVRLRRSRRIWLLLIPPVAGPIGSLVADLYLGVPSTASGEVLGLLVEGGLTSLILLDLVALAAGEELGLRADLVARTLPQSRAALLAGRLLVVLVAPLAGYAVGATTILEATPDLVRSTSTSVGPLFVPVGLAFGLVGLFLALAGTAAVAAVVTRSSSEAIVAGVLAGVVLAGGVAALLVRQQLHAAIPLALGLAGLVALGAAVDRYGRLEQ